MAYDKEKALEALILRVIRQVLAEQAQAKRRLYVVFADAFDCRCVQFLQSLTTADDVTVIVDDTQEERIRRDIELACPFAAVVMTSQARSLPLGGSLTVYPVASRDFIVKAALGMADTVSALLDRRLRCQRDGAHQQQATADHPFHGVHDDLASSRAGPAGPKGAHLTLSLPRSPGAGS